MALPHGIQELKGLLNFQAQPERQELSDSENHRDAAVALVVTLAPYPRLLMIQRAANPSDPWSGQMAFPGGREENTDVDLKATAERETHEEVGLPISELGHYIGPLQPVQGRKGKKMLPFSIFPFIYWLPENESESLAMKVDPAEVANFHWIPFDHLIASTHHMEMDYPGPDFRLRLPAIAFEQQKIWGLSYLILTDFFRHWTSTDWAKEFAHERGVTNWSFWRGLEG